MKHTAALLTAALALGGCDTAFQTITLIDVGVQSGIAVVESGPSSEEYALEKEQEPWRGP